MLTFFTTGKPFRGHTGIIQRNALKSWTLQHLDVEVILFGNEEGAAEAAKELGLRHEPHVERNEFGTKRLDYMFCRAQAIARHALLCYINCDIVLMEDFFDALKRVRERHSKFLMVGRRWDSEITVPLSLESKDWEQQLRHGVFRNGRLRGPEWIDYFLFSRGLYGKDVPPFVVGRVFWDNWLVWKASLPISPSLMCREQCSRHTRIMITATTRRADREFFTEQRLGGITSWQEAGGTCERLRMPPRCCATEG